MLIEAPHAAVLPALARVFGVQSLSLVERRVPAQLAAIVEAGAECFRDARARASASPCARGASATARTIPLSAHSVEIELGTALLPVLGRRRSRSTRS